MPRANPSTPADLTSEHSYFLPAMYIFMATAFLLSSLRVLLEGFALVCKVSLSVSALLVSHSARAWSENKN